ncbi:MAG: amino acid transporter [Bacteroidetes bacterium]|jgi:APA family basic amino acid/polyamine antiporter|nr:amino acid transporter [Bacteroidota bacterium]
MKKSLNLFDTTLLVAGSMIGSGIFIVSADIARVVGSAGWLLVVWILSGVITLFAALSYGELAGMMPQAGGQFVYIKKAFGDLVAFVYGWTVFLVIQTGVIAAVAVAFAKFTGVFIPFFEEGNVMFQVVQLKITSAQLLAIFIIAFLTFINTRGIENGKAIQRIFTSAKLIALFALIIVGIYYGVNNGILSQNLSHAWDAKQADGNGGFFSLSGTSLATALGLAMIGSLFSSDAWNNVTFIAGEVENPKRNIPLGLFFGVSIVTLIYVLANVAYLCLLPLEGSPDGLTVAEQGMMFAQKDRVGTAALFVVFGDIAKYLMAALIMVSTFGCNNGLILAGSRLFQSMAKDGLFFKTTAKLNKFNVPARAMIFQAIWASLLCLSGSYGDLLDYCTFSSLIFYIITIAGLFVLRKKMPDAERPYKAFGYPVIPALYIVLTTLICIDLLVYKTFNCGMGLLIIALGVPVYFMFKRTNNGVSEN